MMTAPVKVSPTLIAIVLGGLLLTLSDAEAGLAEGPDAPKAGTQANNGSESHASRVAHLRRLLDKDPAAVLPLLLPPQVAITESRAHGDAVEAWMGPTEFVVAPLDVDDASSAIGSTMLEGRSLRVYLADKALRLAESVTLNVDRSVRIDDAVLLVDSPRLSAGVLKTTAPRRVAILPIGFIDDSALPVTRAELEASGRGLERWISEVSYGTQSLSVRIFDAQSINVPVADRCNGEAVSREAIQAAQRQLALSKGDFDAYIVGMPLKQCGWPYERGSSTPYTTVLNGDTSLRNMIRGYLTYSTDRGFFEPYALRCPASNYTDNLNRCQVSYADASPLDV